MADNSPLQVSTRPDLTEKLLNRVMRILLRFGLGPGDIFMLEVRGRRSGKIFSTPVDLMSVDGRSYIVSPRGNTQWVRNARAAGEVTLRRGGRAHPCRVEELADADKAPLLKEYVTRYQAAVQRFFAVTPDSRLKEFESVASGYPVFQALDPPGGKGSGR